MALDPSGSAGAAGRSTAVPAAGRGVSAGRVSPEQRWIIPFPLRVLLLLQVTPERAKGGIFSF